MRVLGLDKTKTRNDKEIKVVNVKKFKEDEIIIAFQNKCAEVGK